MEKKYQVFISSTYADLIEERKRVLDAVLIAKCIPAGMEAFSATDESQFDVIKKVIDLCDYYVLIIARRYGSLFPGQDISYTEKEYEYAMNKGIPVLAFILDEKSADYDNYQQEKDSYLASKLELFKKSVSSNRLVSFWKTKDELFGQVVASLYNAFTKFERPGWVRGGKFDENDLLSRIQKLRVENEELTAMAKRANDSSNEAQVPTYENIVFPMHFVETVYIYTSNTRIHTKDMEPTLGQLFKHVSVSITSDCLYRDFEKAVNSFLPGYHVSETKIKELKAKFLIYDLIEEESKVIEKKQELVIKLTKFGRKEMARLNK